MLNSFKYCQDPSAEVPKMFIDQEIGSDKPEDIDGSVFMRELLCLSDEMGKKNIEVWINSPGGVVVEGMKIYTAILESKAKVDTYCFGMAASIAGVIFQAGRNRCMLDFSVLMYHNPYNPDGEKDKGLEALRQSIITMVSKRSGKSEDEVAKIMNKETWILADEALEAGFCDDVRASDEKNKKKFQSTDAKAKWMASNIAFNRTKQPKTMKLVMNKLGLNEDANEASVLSAIASIEAVNKKTIADLEDKKAKMEDELKALKAELEEMKKAKNEAEEEAKAKAEEEAKNAKKKAEEEAEEKVKNLVAAGKIKNDAAIIASFKTLAINDAETFKALSESLPVNKKAPEFKQEVKAKEIANSVKTAAIHMGLKPGSAGYYNYIKANEIKNK